MAIKKLAVKKSLDLLSLLSDENLVRLTYVKEKVG